MFLISAFYQNIDLCEEIIKLGYYFAAAPLVRQEYEIICQIHEIDKDIRKNKKVANAKEIEGFGIVYGDLSILTHLSSCDVIADILSANFQLKDGQTPISLVPIVDNQICKMMYGLHIFLIYTIVIYLFDLFDEMYGLDINEKDKEALSLIVNILLKEGVLAEHK